MTAAAMITREMLSIVWYLRMDDLFDRFHRGGDTCVQDDRRDHDGAEILCPAVTEGMLFIRPASGKPGADDRDHRRERVGQVVDRIQRDRDGMRQNADDRLESSQKHICTDTDETGSDYDSGPCS